MKVPRRMTISVIFGPNDGTAVQQNSRLLLSLSTLRQEVCTFGALHGRDSFSVLFRQESYAIL